MINLTNRGHPHFILDLFDVVDAGLQQQTVLLQLVDFI